MRVLHRARDLRHQAHHFPRFIAQRQRSFLQAPTRRVFHAEVGHAFLALAYLVDRQDVGVIKAGGSFRLAPETRQRLARIGVITQHPLQRHDAARMALPRPVNDTHPAAPDLFQDFVVTQPPLRVGNGYLVERRSEARRVRIFFGDSSVQEATETKAVRYLGSVMANGAFPGRRRDRRQRICQAAEVHGKVGGLTVW